MKMYGSGMLSELPPHLPACRQFWVPPLNAQCLVVTSQHPTGSGNATSSILGQVRSHHPTTMLHDSFLVAVALADPALCPGAVLSAHRIAQALRGRLLLVSGFRFKTRLRNLSHLPKRLGQSMILIPKLSSLLFIV